MWGCKRRGRHGNRRERISSQPSCDSCILQAPTEGQNVWSDRTRAARPRTPKETSPTTHTEGRAHNARRQRGRWECAVRSQAGLQGAARHWRPTRGSAMRTKAPSALHCPTQACKTAHATTRGGQGPCHVPGPPSLLFHATHCKGCQSPRTQATADSRPANSRSHNQTRPAAAARPHTTRQRSLALSSDQRSVRRVEEGDQRSMGRAERNMAVTQLRHNRGNSVA